MRHWKNGMSSSTYIDGNAVCKINGVINGGSWRPETRSSTGTSLWLPHIRYGRSDHNGNGGMKMT